MSVVVAPQFFDADHIQHARRELEIALAEGRDLGPRQLHMQVIGNALLTMIPRLEEACSHLHEVLEDEWMALFQANLDACIDLIRRTGALTTTLSDN